jgi:hypothetical protein
MRARDGDGRIIGARKRTHVCIRGGAAACTPIRIPHTSTYNNIMRTNIHTYLHIHTYISIQHVSRLLYAQQYLHMWTPTHARAHTSARTHGPPSGGTAAHNGPRRKEDARRIDDPPSASRLRWRAARAERAAHTKANVVTRAVFHAPMFALSADEKPNVCEPSHPRSTPTERARMCRRGCVGAQIANAHAHAHGRSTWARVCGGPASAIRSSV